MIDFKKKAKQTLVALANPYGSVKSVYTKAIDHLQTDQAAYLGVKDHPMVTPEIVDYLGSVGFHLHTKDKASLGGRALDMQLNNPVTGKPMTGSSSGTAINVFVGINELGLGTDGGGSVLGPAMALNLFGFIHPGLFKDMVEVDKYLKKSTDGIAFEPSFGLLSRQLEYIERVVSDYFEIDKETKTLKVGISPSEQEELWDYDLDCQILDIPELDKFRASREDLIKNLEYLMKTCDVVLSLEGPVDLEGLGDSLIGHFNEETQALQHQAKKGFLRVVNMCGYVGLSVPCKDLAQAWLLIAKPGKVNLEQLFDLAKQLAVPSDPMLDRYFLNHDLHLDGEWRV